MGVNVYFHVAAMGDFYDTVVAEMCGYFDGSRLYDRADKLNMVTVGDANLTYLTMPKWDIHYGGGLDQYEYPTLRKMWEHSQDHPDDVYLYVHTKGVSSPKKNNRAYEGRRYRGWWRRIMAFHTIGEWRASLDLLNDYDATGIWYMDAPYKHYSGNFFWIRGDYLKTLPEPGPSSLWPHPRINAEVWPLSGNCNPFNLLVHNPNISLVYATEEYRRVVNHRHTMLTSGQPTSDIRVAV